MDSNSTVWGAITGVATTLIMQVHTVEPSAAVWKLLVIAAGGFVGGVFGWLAKRLMDKKVLPWWQRIHKKDTDVKYYKKK